MGIVVRKQKADIIPTGEYVVELRKVTENKEGKFGPVLYFDFVVLEGEHKDKTCRGLVSNDLKQGNKLDKWLVALGAPAIEIDEDFEIDSLVGSRALGYVELSEGDSATFSNVTKLRPYRNAPKSVASVAKKEVSGKSTLDDIPF